VVEPTELALRRAEIRRLVGLGYHVTSRVRCAVRYAVTAGCSITQAAYTFDVNPGAVWNAWDRMFPELPHPLGDQSRSGRGARALELVDGGMSVREAAETIGVNVHTIYEARSKRRAEARAA